MIVQTQAFILGAEDIHSNKSGKDFTKIAFVIEGKFCSFFVLKKDGDAFRQAKPFAALAKSGEPQKCVVTLELDFTERGTFTNVRGVE